MLVQSGECFAQDTVKGIFALTSILAYRKWTPCCPDASHQLSAQYDLPFESTSDLKIFKMATTVDFLDIRTEQL